MKVGRREFLKLFGAAAAGAVVPKGRELEGNGEWHHVPMVWDEQNQDVRLIIDGEDVTGLPLEEYAKRLGLDAVIGNPPSQPQECPECIRLDTLDDGPSRKSREYTQQLDIDQPGSRQWIGGYEWTVSEEDERNCPHCRATLREYDCDFYMSISEGGWTEEWTDPLTGHPHHTALGWGDHGLHTIFRAGDRYLGEALSAQVDPDEHLRSIWAAGQVAAGLILNDRT